MAVKYVVTVTVDPNGYYDDGLENIYGPYSMDEAAEVMYKMKDDGINSHRVDVCVLDEY